MSSMFKIKSSALRLALTAGLLAAVAGFAGTPAAASSTVTPGTTSADYRPSQWVEGGGHGASGETPSLTSGGAEPEGGTGSQLLVGVGLVAFGLVGLALASSAMRRRGAGMRRSRSTRTWRPATHETAKTPARS